MATKPDPVFVRSYEWLQEAIDRLLQATPEVLSADEKNRARRALWQLAGLKTPDAPPTAAALVLEDLENSQALGGQASQGLALAALIAGEFLAALDTIEAAINALSDGLGPADIAPLFKTVGDVVQQVDRIANSNVADARYPVSFALAKLMLSLSGDARATPVAGQSKAHLLAQAVARATVGGAPNNTQVADAAAALGCFTVLAGGLIDRSFAKALNDAAQGWGPAANVDALLPAGVIGPFSIGFGASAGPVRLRVRAAATVPQPVGLGFEAGLDLNASAGDEVKVKLKGSAALQVWQPVLPPGRARVQGAAPQLTLELSKGKKAGKALKLGPQALGDFGKVSLEVKEIGAAVQLALKGAGVEPKFDIFLREGEIKLEITDKLLTQVLSGDVKVAFTVEAQLDAKGRLHLKDGSGLRVSLPLPQLPTGPLDLQLIHLGIEPVKASDGFKAVDCELSASFGIELGPFKGALERIGAVIQLRDLFDSGNAPSVALALKPPSGVGLTLDAGVVKGGGYISFDPARGEYAGTLELQIASIGIKAIAILNTKVPQAGWSLLLLIFGNFPPIQLSWGFTLTGIGGLLGVQHTASTEALSKGLADGALDAILFPANPVADAPQIINTLRTLFPTKAGGFVIGPMIEVGWGTPNLVTIRAGVLIEATQIVILGQAIVQIPPLVGKELAILRLQVDFVGSVVFSPLKIAFDGKLRDSRILFITLTGSFAFRASFGNRPSFLISAGGFHPRFKDIPEDVPAMDRIGVGFSIGIVGVEFKGYFAVTSATIQNGSELRVWADVGIASFDGGFGYDVIVYLEPQFHFEADMRAWVKVMLLGFTIGARIEGLLAGPGRWRAAGIATVDLGFFGEHSVDFDERWGDAVDTPLPIEDVKALLLGEIGKDQNWSVQMPPPADSYVTLGKLEGSTELMAHPRSPLTFRQKALPFGVKLKRLGTKRPKDANQFSLPNLLLAGDAAALPKQAVQDHFAAAQFFDVGEQDRLQGPSFEPFDAGTSMAVDGFASGPAVASSFEHEEVNLSRDDDKKRSLVHLGLNHHALWAVGFGAAARSPRRRNFEPALKAPFAVQPALYATADPGTAQLVGSTGSYAKATAAAPPGAAVHVVEAFEALL